MMKIIDKLIALNYTQINKYCYTLLHQCLSDEKIPSILINIFDSDLLKCIENCITLFSKSNNNIVFHRNKTDIENVSEYLYSNKYETAYLINRDSNDPNIIIDSSFHYYIPIIKNNIKVIAAEYGFTHGVPYILVLLYTYILVNTNKANFNNGVYSRIIRLINAIILNIHTLLFKNKLIKIHDMVPDNVILNGKLKNYIDAKIIKHLNIQNTYMVVHIVMYIYIFIIIGYSIVHLPYSTIMQHINILLSRFHL